MVLTRHRTHPNEALIPCATAQPVERPRAVPAPRIARRPGVSAEVLRELRATDTSWAALGMRRPVAPTPPAARPLPGRDTIAYLAAVSVAIEADYTRHLDTLRVLDDISATLTARPELLAHVADELAKAGRTA